MAYQSRVFWYTRLQPQVKRLEGNVVCDVVVIGGGAAGLVCAHQLAKAGKKVVVLEASFCGGGASGKSSGFITPDSELELSDIVRERGLEKAKELWSFVTGGVSLLKDIITQYNLACDYQVQDSLFIANDTSGFEVVSHEHKTRVSAGYDSRLYTKDTIRQVIGSRGYDGGVAYGGTFGMSAYLFCQELKTILQNQGVHVYEETPVTGHKSGVVYAGSFSVTAQEQVFCGDHFLPSLGILRKEVYHAQTFLSVSEPLTDGEISKMFPERRYMVWDTDLIYQYFRITGDNRLLFGTASLLFTYWPTEWHRLNIVYRKMTNYIQKKFPGFTGRPAFLWPGLIGVSKDFVPLAGELPERKGTYYLAGAAGIPWAAALGSYISEKVLTGRSDLDTEFTAQRHYPVPNWLQSVISKPLSFAIAHGLAKYLR